MVWRGVYEPALRILSEEIRAPAGVEERIEELTLQAVALTHLQQLSVANDKLAQAENLCGGSSSAACGGVLRARGILAMERGQVREARQLFLSSLSFARTHQDQSLETTALLNLGTASLQIEHYDEALEWSTAAYQAGIQSRDENRAQGALGNMGWAYVELGDTDKALQLFSEAEKAAAQLGNARDDLKWLTTAGYVYESSGDFSRAAGAYHRALTLAQQINSKEDIVNSLESLAHLAIDDGNPDEAAGYLQQLDPLIRANGNRLDALDLTLAQARIAAARHQDQQAETLFRAVDTDPASQITMRLAAEHFLANLYERQGRLDAARAEYVTALATFESERNQLKNENSRLPFFANATPIYDDYIHLLIQQGEVKQALAVADQSRARTLAQGLGLTTKTADPVAAHPTAIARSADAILLFYWLGEKQSYLWAVTPQTTAVFTLPTRSAIAPWLDRYRQTLLGPDDPSRDPDGQALYRILVAPAARLLRPNARIVVLTDGILSQLNFETLIVPGPTPHYFIEDADILSAPSLHMLAAAHTASHSATRKLLLLGNAVSPSPDYPQLPNAAVEMQEIRRHFPPHDQTVFAGPRATPAAYLASAPRQFSDIDFVAHGVASRTDPLDSAIILSRPGANGLTVSQTASRAASEDTFKLYARDIIQHPIDARLVTISTCSGSGSRSYAGEGLVGLSWAFLRAGAHNVIAALWEASDASTPRLMNALYNGLEQGLSPSAALRQAKLALLHSNSAFRRPFYWAPFQLYTGL